MAVHAYIEKIMLTAMAFEARYDDGLRYIDHCGETISRIRKYDKSWVFIGANANTGTMLNKPSELALSFGIDRLNVARQEPAMLENGEEKAEVLGRQCESLYEIIVQGIRVPETSRVGIRYRFTAPSDTLEEADRFVNRGVKSPLLETVLKSTKSAIRDSAVSYVVEELESGYRRRIVIETQVTVPAGAPVHTGLEKTGDAAVSIDIDTFTRPESGNFQKSNLFIQNNYNRSRLIALDIFNWLRQQQR